MDEVYAQQFEKFEFLFKWGCDGTSGVNEYMQLFHREDSNVSEENEEEAIVYSNNSIFMFSAVPLQFLAIANGTQEKVIQWENPHPSSTRYCRPIKFLFAKETKNLTKQEINKMKEEIAALQPLEYLVNGNTDKNYFWSSCFIIFFCRNTN